MNEKTLQKIGELKVKLEDLSAAVETGIRVVVSVDTANHILAQVSLDNRLDVLRSAVDDVLSSMVEVPKIEVYKTTDGELWEDAIEAAWHQVELDGDR